MTDQLLPVIKGLVRQNTTGDIPASIGDQDIYDAHYFAALFGFVIMGMGILVAALGKFNLFDYQKSTSQLPTPIDITDFICPCKPPT